MKAKTGSINSREKKPLSRAEWVIDRTITVSIVTKVHCIYLPIAQNLKRTQEQRYQ